jgi:hypothetical protein
MSTAEQTARTDTARIPSTPLSRGRGPRAAHLEALPGQSEGDFQGSRPALVQSACHGIKITFNQFVYFILNFDFYLEKNSKF